MRLVFVTGNEHKVREVCDILPKASIAHQQLDLPEIQGDIESIAREKATFAAKALQCSVLVEDCALCFSAFGNALPGPYIKDFVRSIGTGNIPRLLSDWADKGATAVCTFAVCTFPELEGEIVDARGSSGFGWDAVFQPDGHPKTYAEMDKSEKNAISHRRKALDELCRFIK